MRRLALLLLGLALGACAPGAAAPAPEPAHRPQRVASLDYCADQFVLKLADRDQIAAVSLDADAPYSYMRAEAVGAPQRRAEAETLVALQPDLVVRSYGGGPLITRLMGETGVEVAQLGYASDFDGVRANIRLVAAALGHPARGEALIAEMDARLAAIPPAEAPARALYVTPSGVTAGTGELVDAIFRAAGLENYQRAPGWAPLPLERIAVDPPELVAPVTFGADDDAYDHWSAARHPIVRRLSDAARTAPMQAAWTVCGGWYVAEAAEALAAARR